MLSIDGIVLSIDGIVLSIVGIVLSIVGIVLSIVGIVLSVEEGDGRRTRRGRAGWDGVVSRRRRR